MRSLPHDPRKLAAIYFGGVAGALIRVGLAEVASTGPGQWPWATFAVNMAGALLLGYFFMLFRDHPEESLRHPFLAPGVCGTLTTFSTLQLELYEMVDGGHLALAAGYCAATVAVGYAFLRAGMWLERGQGSSSGGGSARAIGARRGAGSAPLSTDARRGAGPGAGGIPEGGR